MTRREILKQGGLALTALTLPYTLTAFAKYNDVTDTKEFDVIIIGGSYAGLSAAMALGRSLRNVLIIDGGQACNKQTPHSHNFLTQDGKTPQEISTLAKQQVENYETIKFYNGIATSGIKTENGFEITTVLKDKFNAKKLVFATGLKDLMPDIKGFSECWGISVIHCPYCHGYEYRNQNTAIIANGDKAFHLASLVNNLTKKVTVLTNGIADFDEKQIDKLRKHKIKVIESKIIELEHTRGHIKHVVFNEDHNMVFDVMYAAVPFSQHSDIPATLGCEMTEQGYVKVDFFMKTTIEGVFACGDNSVMMRSIANAVYTGNFAGAIVNSVLTTDQF